MRGHLALASLTGVLTLVGCEIVEGGAGFPHQIEDEIVVVLDTAGPGP